MYGSRLGTLVYPSWMCTGVFLLFFACQQGTIIPQMTLCPRRRWSARQEALVLQVAALEIINDLPQPAAPGRPDRPAAQVRYFDMSLDNRGS
jgi:hypothetical protein